MDGSVFLLYMLTGEEWDTSSVSISSEPALQLLTLWQQLLTMQPNQVVALYIKFSRHWGQEVQQEEERLTLLSKNVDEDVVDVCKNFGEQGVSSVTWERLEEWFNIWDGTGFDSVLEDLFFDVTPTNSDNNNNWHTHGLFCQLYTLKNDTHTNLRLAHFYALCHQYQFQSKLPPPQTENPLQQQQQQQHL